MIEDAISDEILKKSNDYTLLTGGLHKSINVAFVPRSMWVAASLGTSIGTPGPSVMARLESDPPPRWESCKDGFILDGSITVYIAEKISTIFVCHMETPANIFSDSFKNGVDKVFEEYPASSKAKENLTVSTSKAPFVLLRSGTRINTSEISRYSLVCTDNYGHPVKEEFHGVHFVLKDGYTDNADNNLMNGTKLIEVLDRKLLEVI